MSPTLRFRVIYERKALVNMEISFFALPSKQGPVQGRFKPAHLLISLSARVPACVRRFETPTALNDGRAESKKDISMLFSPVSFSGEQRYCDRDVFPDLHARKSNEAREVRGKHV